MISDLRKKPISSRINTDDRDFLQIEKKVLLNFFDPCK